MLKEIVLRKTTSSGSFSKCPKMKYDALKVTKPPGSYRNCDFFLALTKEKVG